MTTIQKVADLAGVSTATVSRALAGKKSVSATTKARVEAAAKQLGYVASSAASSLASGRNRNIGVVVPFLDGWFYMRVLKGAHDALSDAGYDLTLYHLDQSATESASRTNPRRERLFDEFLRRQRVDGFIAVSLELTDAELELIRTIGKPAIGIGGPLPGALTLSIDDTAIARLATEHLIALGHREIAHIGGDAVLDLDFHLPANRRVGYEAALAAHGLTANPLLVRFADFTIAGGYRATLQLLGDPRIAPTAVFAASDEMAMGAIMAARDLGKKVPDDLSIIGIDGHELGEFFGLTTISQFPETQGRLAAEAVLRILDGEPVTAQNVPLPFELIVRRSTSAPADR
ncbi:LacI family DNA-binding transcriptional regulator [Demequina lutea]|uniref:DNA-binding LacI/PurR family transcriptional regulator n=1 Tax=Demequina lutea TaxID=431489 RepID=A0A7Y9ZAF2_9MICO|nr:LacI family DNA-binding transcriptional regulator [Demequina lutea]NYI41180.1 DNA-binding LacI/PurR family transcriptional regulator [Demequina lutea]